MAEGPLHGIKVLEFSQIVAGPYTGLNLSDLGADVIKVEPPAGDSVRSLGAVFPGESKGFQSLNRGKRGLALDLHDPRAQAIIHRLVAGTDVVTINYRYGVAEQLHIDYGTLRGYRPDLIYAQITGFGARGPFATRAGSDLAVQGYSGLMAGEGKLDGAGAPIAIASTPLSDFATGLATAMAICAALFHRQRTGEGQRINTSLLATALALQGGAVMREPVTDASLRDPMLAEMAKLRDAGATYAELIACRGGNPNIVSAFRLYYSAYRARDGGIVLGALTKANRDAMRRVLGLAGEDSDDEGFNPLDPANIARIAQWRDQIQKILLTRTAAAWVAAFQAAGAPVSAVNIPEEMSDDEQVAALGLMVTLEHELTGPQRQVGPVVEMSATPPRVRMPSPPLGRHTDDILTEAGMNAHEIARLRAAGVVM